MAPQTPDQSAPSADDPHVRAVARNALRISFSQDEYRQLHQHVVERLPPAIQKRAYTPSQFDSIVKSPDSFNEAAIRSSLRVFLSTAAGMKLFDIISERLVARDSS